LSEVHEHQEQHDEMSELNVFLKCDHIFVTFLGFVSWLPSGIANQIFLLYIYIYIYIYILQRKLKIKNGKGEVITNISTVKYDVMYVDICCSTDSMTCGSPVQISLNRLNMFVSLFYDLHSRPPKENS